VNAVANDADENQSLVQPPYQGTPHERMRREWSTFHRTEKGVGMSQPLLGSPVQGAVFDIQVQPGQRVRAGQVLLLLESMKMEVPVVAPGHGMVIRLLATVGEAVEEHQPLIEFAPGPAPDESVVLPDDLPARSAAAGPRPDLQRLLDRRALLQDHARVEAMAVRHAAGGRSARENLADLLDVGSFSEYGAMAVAAQRSRRTLDDLQRNTPADGLITGTGLVNAALLGEAPAQVAVMIYDYTVLAGTQGSLNHAKSDRLLGLASRLKLPLVLFAEGGGGRPGDVDSQVVAGLHCTTFGALAALAGQVPLVGIVNGRCFAGNAALLGCCHVVIATESASIGMGGPAMIEGGGLGRVAADEVGPIDVQVANGVVDVRVADEAAAVAVAKRYLALMQAPVLPARPAAMAADALRNVVPESRNALYDVRAVVRGLVDEDSDIELRAGFGRGVLTFLARIEGRAVAVAASHVHHLGGALDAPACDKLARFMQLADHFGLPLVTLVDTPGFMVGPASERTAMVRHAGRLFVTAAALRVPVVSVVLRRGYGLGAMALTAGHFHAPVATLAWPSGEFGAMGLEGAVRLGFRKELAAAPEADREALFERLLQESIDRGQALNMASHLEIDEVIDPAETRPAVARALRTAATQPLPPRRPFVDAW
jgi:acetyl-CoA carboxylase carboxyltransferase component/biotin carboxyl carrier protein